MKARLTRGQLAAVVAGNALEFYDFLIFGFFAIQIGQAFFPREDPTASLLMTLGVFGAGFLTRPLGGLVLGRLSDRIGRKPVMLFTFALMGFAIAGLALTPTHASIGIAAPILALVFRLLQGFALGGELGPTTAYLMEAAPLNRRGLYVSLQNATQYVAVLGVGIVGTLLTSLMPEVTFGAWGWRLAMLLGAVVIPFAYVMRRRLPETLQAQSEASPASSPPLLLALLALVMIAAATISNYCLNYAALYVQHVLGMSAQTASIVTVLGASMAVAGSLLGGWLSDRWGRKPVMLLAGLAIMALGVPCYLAMLASPSMPVVAGAMALLSLFIGMYPAALLTSITESFPTLLRARSVGFLYAVAVAVFGGSAQYVATWLIGATGSQLAPAWYMSGAMLLGVTCLLALRETAPAKVRGQ